MKWEEKYELAKLYYEKNKHLNIPMRFKTKNGIDYDENGVALGNWIHNQRQALKGNGTGKLTVEKIELLNKIGMCWNLRDWMEKYELVKTYYKHYGNIKINIDFKTKNGIDYDENGIALGTWLNTQRQALKGNNKCTITEEQIELLSEIGMRWKNIDPMNKWMQKYKLAKNYYEKNKHLNIPMRFKTKDGIDYDENGVALGNWIHNQRQALKGNGTVKLTVEKIELLNKIGMCWNLPSWEEKYNLAKNYYDHYGNLEVPYNFRTKNGIEYDKDGIDLGSWLHTQRQAIKAQTSCKINEKQINLLNKIGMRWNNIGSMNKWMKKYELAKIYYEHHNNLEIPLRYKTINGYEYNIKGIALGNWISCQRLIFQGKIPSYNLTLEQIKLLNEIGMRWDNLDKKNNKELIDSKNLIRKKIEILNKLKLALCEYEETSS